MTPQEQPDSQAGDELDRILQTIYDHAYLNGFSAREAKTVFDTTKFSKLPKAEAKEQIRAYAERLATERAIEARIDELNRTFIDGYASFKSPEDDEIYGYQHSANFYKLRLAELEATLTKEAEK